MYVGIGLLFARRKLLEAAQAPAERGELLRWSARQADTSTPPCCSARHWGFGLQCAVIGHRFWHGLQRPGPGPLLHGPGAGAAWLLRRTHQPAGGNLPGAGGGLRHLAIPLGLDARWTSAAWAVEGAGIYWLGLHQQRRLARIFALLLQGGAAWPT